MWMTENRARYDRNYLRYPSGKTQRPFLRPTAAAIIAAGCSKLWVEPSSGRIGDDTAAAEAFWLGPGAGSTQDFMAEPGAECFGMWSATRHAAY